MYYQSAGGYYYKTINNKAIRVGEEEYEQKGGRIRKPVKKKIYNIPFTDLSQKGNKNIYLVLAHGSTSKYKPRYKNNLIKLNENEQVIANCYHHLTYGTDWDKNIISNIRKYAVNYKSIKKVREYLIFNLIKNKLFGLQYDKKGAQIPVCRFTKYMNNDKLSFHDDNEAFKNSFGTKQSGLWVVKQGGLKKIKKIGTTHIHSDSVLSLSQIISELRKINNNGFILILVSCRIKQ